MRMKTNVLKENEKEKKGRKQKRKKFRQKTSLRSGLKYWIKIKIIGNKYIAGIKRKGGHIIKLTK